MKPGQKRKELFDNLDTIIKKFIYDWFGDLVIYEYLIKKYHKVSNSKIYKSFIKVFKKYIKIKYFIACTACLIVFFIYSWVFFILGWKYGGGLITLYFLYASINATWKKFTKDKSLKNIEYILSIQNDKIKNIVDKYPNLDINNEIIEYINDCKKNNKPYHNYIKEFNYWCAIKNSKLTKGINIYV